MPGPADSNISFRDSPEAENGLPPGVIYRVVMEEEHGEYPRVNRRFTPRPCMQCDNPPCVRVCPVKATFKRPDGVVAIDYHKCLGCRYCIVSCPYGARTFDSGDFYTKETPQLMPYEKTPTFEYSEKWQRQEGESPVGNARKCHFCLHRVNNGLLPACVVTCIGRATYFGDLAGASTAAKMLNRPNVNRLKEDLGTQPRVYYLW